MSYSLDGRPLRHLVEETFERIRHDQPQAHDAHVLCWFAALIGERVALLLNTHEPGPPWHIAETEEPAWFGVIRQKVAKAIGCPPEEIHIRQDRQARMLHVEWRPVVEWVECEVREEGKPWH